MNEVRLEGQDRSGDVRRVLVDQSGRLSRSYDFRDVTATGHVTMSSSAESTVISGDADNFLDLVYVSGANTSNVAVNVNIRSGTANGSHMDVFTIPPNDHTTINYNVPLLGSEKDAAWTVEFDDADVSNTSVLITMLAHKNGEAGN